MHRRAARDVLGVLIALALAGCEAPPRPGADLAVLSTTPDEGAENVPISVVPRVVLDRPLDPTTVDADAFRLYSGDLVPGGAVAYSVVDRSLTFTPGVTLRTRLAYAARLADGVRGIDGSAPVSPVELVFVTGSDDRGRPAPPPDPTFDGEILPLVTARCSSCHAPPAPAGGLSLASADDILRAAATTSSEWLGWAVVAAGSPARSYLLYKVTGSPGLVGRQMPPGEPLALDDARKLERWIAMGAGR
ncbi:MAG: Ig-like domain-containing protein [Deltaproteobacteria bacterium]|nr:Ig-like domain-containing protein [Deltaproteobacteria bacterium]